MKLMVEMNAINTEVFQAGHSTVLEIKILTLRQRTLTEFGAAPAGAGAAPVLPPPQPLPAIPPHMQPPVTAAYRTATPPQHTPTPPYPGPTYPGANGYPAYNGPTSNLVPAAPPALYPPQPAPSIFSATPVQAPAPPPVAAPPPTGALANMSEEQKALIVRVLSMTAEQINMLPPHERNLYIQIVGLLV